MKKLLTVLLVTSFFSGYTQTNTTKYSKSLPAKINCRSNDLSNVFAKRAGEKIQFSFPDNFIAEGFIKTSIVNTAEFQTAIIELPEFNKSLFQISKRVNSDKSISYVGRIINTDEGYLYELKSNGNDEYQLTKQELNKVRPACDVLQ